MSLAKSSSILGGYKMVKRDGPRPQEGHHKDWPGVQPEENGEKRDRCLDEEMRTQTGRKLKVTPN